MNHIAQRILALLLALIFCVSLFPASALAEEPAGEIAPEAPAGESGPLPEEPADDGEPEDEDGIPIDENLFPDPVFRAYISGNMDLDGDGSLSLEEIAAISAIDISASSVTSLEGVQLFSELTQLIVRGEAEAPGGLTQVDLSGNAKLVVLDLGFNPLTELDVSVLPSLQLLEVEGCGLTELDLSLNGALSGLSCEDNALSSLELSGCPNLARLFCYGNDGLTELDIRPCPALAAAYQAGGRHLDWMQAISQELYDNVIVYGGSGDYDYALAVNTSVTVIAENPVEEPVTGTCGEDLFWSLQGGELIISGAGNMKNWTNYTSAPWKDYRDQITRVVILPGVTSIGNYAFYNCSKLTDVTIPDTVTYIGSYAFYSCEKLTGVTIPDGVTAINNYTFAYCESLRHIDIPSGVTTIGRNAFHTCSSLGQIDLPDTVTSIGAGAFNRCEALRDFTIPPLVTVIEDGTFYQCYGFETVTIPEGVTSIGDQAFCRCLYLYRVTLPQSLTTIKSDAFYYCPKLEEITIPANVTSIGSMAFLYCYDLEIIRFEGSAPSIGDSCFESVEADVYYPAGDPSWTDEVCLNYGGKLTWICRWKNFPSPLDKDLTSEKLHDYAVVVYENHNLGKNNEDNYKLASSVHITGGSADYLTDSKGAARINLDGSVTFEKKGYITRTLTARQLLQNNAVYLEKESPPAILAVWARSNTGYDRDVRHQTLEINSRNSAYWLEPEIYWGDNGPGELYLYQASEQQEALLQEVTLKDGAFLLTSANFDLTKKVYLVAKDSKGQTSKRELKLHPDILPESIDGLTLKLDADVSFTLPSSAGWFAGSKMKIQLPSKMKIPVKVKVEDGRWYAAIGFYEQKISYDSDKGWETKNYVEEVKTLKKSLETAQTEWEKFRTIRKTMKDNKKWLQEMDGSFGVDCKFVIMGFAEGYVDPNGGLGLTDGGVYIMMSASGNLTQPFVLGPLPMFFEFSLSNDFAAQISLALREETKELAAFTELENVFSVSGGVGVGVNKVANLSFGITGELTNKLRFDEGLLAYYQLKGALKGYIKLKILFFSWEKSDEFASSTWYEWPEPGSIPEDEDYTPSIYEEMFDTSQYRRDDLRYLTAGSPMLPGSASVLRADQPAQGSAAFLANAYEGADPQTLRFADGTILAVWIGYNNASSGPDALQLYFAFFDGESWSEPRPVESDGTMDASPALALSGDTAWLIWQDCSHTIQDSDSLDDVAGMMGVSAASFDRESGSFTVSELARADGSFPSEPMICSDGSAVYAVWRQNTAGDIFGLSGEERILYSSLTDEGWSALSVLYSAEGPILSLTAQAAGGGLSVAWCCDTDGDLGTSDDLEIYRDGARLTENEWIDSGAVFSGGSLFWFAGGALVADGSPILPEDVTVGDDRFQVVTGDGFLAILYTESDGLATVLKAIVYDSAVGAWGEPVTVSGGSTGVPCFSASFGAGELSVLMEEQAIVGQLGENDPYGACSLQWYNIPLTCDIAVTELQYDNRTYQEGYDMLFTAHVRNKGLVTVDTVLAEVLDAEGTVLGSNTVSVDILPGAEKPIETWLRVESIEQGKTVTVRVTPLGRTDVDPENNSAEAVLLWNDLSVEKGRFGVTPGGEYVIHANLVNRGHDPQQDIVVELHELSPEGTLAAQITVPALAPFSTVPVSFAVGTDPAQAYYILTPHREDDCDGADDQDLVAIERRLFAVIAYDASGGSVEAESVALVPGEAIGALPIPAREGWVFLGWFLEPAESFLLAGQGTPVTEETVFTENAVIYAHWRLPGDINGDGKLNNKDVTRLQKYLKGDTVEINEAALDANGDGKVNNKDLTRLQKYLKGDDVEIH